MQEVKVSHDNSNAVEEELIKAVSDPNGLLLVRSVERNKAEIPTTTEAADETFVTTLVKNLKSFKISKTTSNFLSWESRDIVLELNFDDSDITVTATKNTAVEVTILALTNYAEPPF